MSFPRACSTRTMGLCLMVLLLGTSAPSPVPADAQVRPRPAPAARAAEIVEVYGRRALRTGETENFRVRLADGTPTPVEYVWDFGDGTLAEGNNAVHRYRQAGRYRLLVTARNAYGSDADTLYVAVTGPPVTAAPPAGGDAAPVRATPARPAEDRRAAPPPDPDTAPTALRAREEPPAPAVPPPGDAGLAGNRIAWEQGGYAWRVRTYFEQDAAERSARAYQQAGYRVGVITDESGPGSVVYRVVLGQFDTVERALRAKSHLPHQEGVFLMELAGVVPDPPPGSTN